MSPFVGLAFLLLALLLLAAIVGVRRFERAQLSSSYQLRIDQLQKRLNLQEDTLRSITDSLPGTLAIFDQKNHYWFINRQGAEAIGHDIRDIVGNAPGKLMNPDRARKLESRLADVRSHGRSIETVDQVTDQQGRMRFMQVHYENIAPFGDFGGGILMRGEDLTNFILERERRETMLRQVIATLVAVIDRRDPYAAGHSARVGQLARVIAEELMLDEKQIDAAEIAGSLMNFGKVLVPREILTKTTPLTSDELQRVRESILTSADILSIIDFFGPVVPTLRQVLERFDGSGVPDGLKGDAILITARVVTVANAYVALVSPRAHRPSMEFKNALESMEKDADKAFDRRVVNALASYVENRPAKLDWLTRTKHA